MLQKHIYIILILILSLFTISPITKASTYSSGSLLALANTSQATVYYIGEDNKKYAFPDSKTYFTYYDNFDNVQRVNLSTLDSYPDGGTMPYKAGTKLITHQNTAKIYAVEPNGLIRWIPTEEIAQNLYGSTWYLRVQDVIPGYFSTSYQLGENLSDTLPNGTIVRLRNTNTYYYIENGQKRVSTEYQNYNTEDIVEVDDVDNYSDGDSSSNDNSTSTPPVTTPPGGGGGGGGTPTPTPTPTPVDNDSDNDGYDSTSSGGTDCNDSSSSIHPGAVDICGDSIDQDCSGSDLSCPAPSTNPGNPTIDSLSSAILINNQDFIIYGSGFGSKSQAAPLAWDDFQDGNIGARVLDREEPGGSSFDLQSAETRRPTYSDAIQRYQGDISALQDYSERNNKAIALHEEFYKIYATFWLYREDYAGTAMNVTNTKLYGNVNGGTNGWTELPESRWDEYWYNDSAHIQMNDCNAVNRLNTWFSSTPNLGHWIRVERWIDMGDVGQANGYIYGKIDGQTIGEGSGLFRPSECANNPFYGFVLGHYFRTEDGSGALLRQYVSDMYVDNTRARLEICNSQNKSTANHCEIQIPHNTWNNSQIQFTANLGSLNSGTAYLFVIDANGNVSSGYPVNI